MKKRILLLLILFIGLPIMVNAENLVNVNISTEFNEEINLDDISGIEVEFTSETDAYVTLTSDSNYEGTIYNVDRSLYSSIDSANVVGDEINRYPITWTINNNGSEIDVQITVGYDKTKQTGKASSDAVLKNLYKIAYGTDYVEETTTSTTKKTAVATIKITTAKNSKSNSTDEEETTTVDKSKLSQEELEELEKEQNKTESKKKTNKIINIIIVIIVIFLLVCGVHIALKIARANK